MNLTGINQRRYYGLQYLQNKSGGAITKGTPVTIYTVSGVKSFYKSYYGGVYPATHVTVQDIAINGYGWCAKFWESSPSEIPWASDYAAGTVLYISSDAGVLVSDLPSVDQVQAFAQILPSNVVYFDPGSTVERLFGNTTGGNFSSVARLDYAHCSDTEGQEFNGIQNFKSGSVASDDCDLRVPVYSPFVDTSYDVDSISVSDGVTTAHLNGTPDLGDVTVNASKMTISSSGKAANNASGTIIAKGDYYVSFTNAGEAEDPCPADCACAIVSLPPINRGNGSVFVGDANAYIACCGGQKKVAWQNSGNTFTGSCTFSGNIFVSTPTQDTEAANKKYVDDNAGGGGATTSDVTYYISPTGANSDAGSSDAPWADIEYAWQKATQRYFAGGYGVTIQCLAGVYQISSPMHFTGFPSIAGNPTPSDAYSGLVIQGIASDPTAVRLSGLVNGTIYEVDTIAQAGGTMRLNLNGTPDLSNVVIGKSFVAVAGSGIAANNAGGTVTGKGDYYVEITNGGTSEDPSAATCAITRDMQGMLRFQSIPGAFKIQNLTIEGGSKLADYHQGYSADAVFDNCFGVELNNVIGRKGCSPIMFNRSQGYIHDCIFSDTYYGAVFKYGARIIGKTVSGANYNLGSVAQYNALAMYSAWTCTGASGNPDGADGRYYDNDGKWIAHDITEP